MVFLICLSSAVLAYVLITSLFDKSNEDNIKRRISKLSVNDGIDGIFEHKYRSEFNPDSFIRTLITWQARNNMHIYFCKKENTARMIYELCKNCLDAKILQ